MRFVLYGCFPVTQEFQAIRAFLEWQGIRHVPCMDETEMLKRSGGKRQPVLVIEHRDAEFMSVGFFEIVEKIKELGLCQV